MAIKIKDPNYALVPEPVVRAFREFRQTLEGTIAAGGTPSGAHAASHAIGGMDPVSPASIGAATEDHNHTDGNGVQVDHGMLGGLNDVEDHAYALLVNGGRQLAADWDAGPHVIRASGLGVRDATGALRYRWVYNESLDTMDLEYAP